MKDKVIVYFCIDDEYYPVRTCTMFTKKGVNKFGPTKVYENKIDLRILGLTKEEYEQQVILEENSY